MTPARPPRCDGAIPPRPGQDWRSLVDERRKLWGRGLVLGGSFGLGAPLGVLGIFAQVDLSPRVGIAWGVGRGGLGTAGSAMVWLRPLPLGQEWMPVLGLGYSVNVTPSQYRSQPDWSVPFTSRWLNAELASEWRVSTGRMVRFGFGHAFLLNGGSYGCRGQEGFCQAASESNVPGWAPYGGGTVGVRDVLAYAKPQEDGSRRLVHMWFLHVDFAALVPF